jgi:hypothetical protein
MAISQAVIAKRAWALSLVKKKVAERRQEAYQRYRREIAA